MIAVGVDTHKHEHLARAIDGLGQVLGALTITTSLRGYGELAQWLRTLGEGVVVGIEGAGSYGAGLSEYLLAEGFDVVEVERPRREDRRRGKSDEIDALLAAKKVLAADGLSTPRAGGTRQALAALLIAQRSCISERTRLVNQLQSLHTTAPVALRERIGPGNGRRLAARLVKMRARTDAPQSERLIFTVLRDLARRTQELAAQADAYKHELTALISSSTPPSLTSTESGRLSSQAAAVTPSASREKPRSRAATAPRPNPPPPAKPSATSLPRSRPPSQQRATHHRPHPRPPQRANPRLPRPPHQRRQDPPRSHARPQTPHLPAASTDDSSPSP
jgi:transposase